MRISLKLIFSAVLAPFSRSMKQNLVVLLGDLFNLFEIHPAKCVAYPGMEQQMSSECKFKYFSQNSTILQAYGCGLYPFATPNCIKLFITNQ